MKKVIKKIVFMITAIITLSLCMGAMGVFDCGPSPVRFERVTEGNFKLVVYSAEAKIEGLSDLGKEQKIIIVPDRLLGRPVSFGGADTEPGYNREDYYLESENLEALYIVGYVSGGPRIRCPNLKKIIFMKPRSATSYGTIPAYGSFKRGKNPATFLGLTTANISYDWNYSEAPNAGDYWIDNFDYGTTISFVPPVPVREGYEFGGWYKESECLNPWDFESDTLPQEIRDEDENTVYQETILYAKWIEN